MKIHTQTKIGSAHLASRRTHALCATVLLAASAWLGCCSLRAADQPLSREDTVLVTVTASVEAIDRNTREITLKGPLGNKETFVVDKKVKRFGEIKVGDFVRADYYLSIAADLRKPTTEEKESPIELLGTVAKAPPGVTPAVGGLRQFKVVTTVEGLDRPTKTITVKGPRGNYLTARVPDASRLTELKIGDNIVITYTEAVAVSLEKASKQHAD